MKTLKKFLRYWFAVASVLTFMGGWAMLAHSLKPVQPTQASNSSSTVLQNLPPIQSYDGTSNSNSSLNLISPGIQSNSSFPMLRTGGS